MVETQQVREEFVARLNEALDGVPGVRKVRGRNVDMHGLLVEMGFERSKQATHKWLNAESMPEKESMRLLAKLCRVRAEWLEYGDGPKYPGDKDDNEERESNVIAADFSSKGKLKDGELSIPQYNVRGALGHGQVPADYIETIRHVTVHESLLSGRGISFSKAENLAIITGFGQSMEGTINDGDPLIVDRGINQFIGDGIYVLTWDGLLYVKRLQKHSPTHFDMISDNPRHKDQTINIADVTIHARVLLVWNAKKL
jgi:phage repressor protein C with HTH and peptisase S24 domain